MSHTLLKPTRANIISLWFGADTPIREYKIRMNPTLWAACERVNRTFRPPSGALTVDSYRRSDVVCFARAVQQEMNSFPVGTINQPAASRFRTMSIYESQADPVCA